jgi:hypothetical protein
MDNMADAIVKELKRNRELLKVYRSIPTGIFGALAIEHDIDRAEKALANGDVIKIIQAYETLKNNE